MMIWVAKPMRQYGYLARKLALENDINKGAMRTINIMKMTN